MGSSFIVDSGRKGFESFCNTFTVRHRLMHPKDVFSVEVRDTDIQVAESGLQWFNQQCEDVLNQCRAHTAATIEKDLEVLRKKRGGK
jgi:hypothetical protein